MLNFFIIFKVIRKGYADMFLFRFKEFSYGYQTTLFNYLFHNVKKAKSFMKKFIFPSLFSTFVCISSLTVIPAYAGGCSSHNKSNEKAECLKDDKSCIKKQSETKFNNVEV